MPIPNKFKSYISFAKEIKNEMQTGRSFHCSVALKNGRLIEYGINRYDKEHLYYKFGKYKSNRTNNKNVYYHSGIHSEIDLIKKLSKHNIHKLTLLNIRIDNNGNIAQACPCENCRRILKQYKFKKIYYTIDNEHIGRLYNI